MRVTIDGLAYEEFSNLTNDIVWDEIRKTIEQQNRFIQQVKVNGDILTEETSIPYKDVNFIEVDTMGPQELLLHTFQSAIDYLPGIVEGLLRISEMFRIGSEGEGIKLYLQIEGGLNWNTQVLQNCQLLLSTSNIEKIYKNYCGILNEMLSALENHDYISLADLMEYEMVPCLQEWIAYMKEQRSQKGL